MPAPKPISFFIAALFVASCGQADIGAESSDAVKTLDAKTAVTFQRSLSAIESDMTADKKAELGRAMDAIIMLPESGACDEAAFIDHAQKFKDPAFRQNLNFKRLHGLTAEQILSLRHERACKPIAIPEVETKNVSVLSSSEAKQPLASAGVKELSVSAEPYMTAQYSQRYAKLSLSCISRTSTKWNLAINISVTDRAIPPVVTEGGTTFYTSQEGEWLGGHSRGLFWQRGDVYFDGVKTLIPSIYKKIEKKVTTGLNTFEVREERLLVGPEKAYEVLLRNLKKADTMRLQYRDGTGPTFDLTKIKFDIENLEATCAPKDAN